MAESLNTDDKVMRLMPFTASFVMPRSLKTWIEEEAKRRKVSQSELVREILERARDGVAA